MQRGEQVQLQTACHFGISMDRNARSSNESKLGTSAASPSEFIPRNAKMAGRLRIYRCVSEKVQPVVQPVSRSAGTELVAIQVLGQIPCAEFEGSPVLDIPKVQASSARELILTNAMFRWRTLISKI